MKTFAEKFINRNGCSMYIRVRGKGPALLMIHGVATDADYFEDVADLLAENFTVITYDRRGYSRSVIMDALQDTEANASVEAQAADAAAIIKIVAEKAVVVGVSAGGIVALELSRAFPELVEELFLYEIAHTTEPATLARRDEWQGRLRKAAEKKSFAKGMLLFIEAIGERDPEGAETGPAQLQRNVKNLEILMYVEMENYFSYSRRHPDLKFSFPLFCGVGSLDKGKMFYDMMTESAALWGAELEELPGAHNLAQDRPAVFAKWIKNKTLYIGGENERLYN